ncbi:WD repeat-containing protein 90 isoform X2 [Denticeps clupeoides]|uniref:WD repeat-containing protein 90 isoform X2 n=1 Tax=Denticeps clupeoides TaxID=299321 RepID=UPI0010A53CCC|nr:WD repeat-containing protein 90 isoform X2 [Denticeps clupeoides]
MEAGESQGRCQLPHGSVPASNFIQFPKSGSQSLGLTGRFFYLLFRPTPGKQFVAHLDIAAEDGQVIRVSFSNTCKEFKSTSTWLQFPFLCSAVHGSVFNCTAHAAKNGLVGPAPEHVRWVCLCMDLRSVLSSYLNRHYSHLKAIKLCANMSVKNVMTSDLLLQPGVDYSAVKHGAIVLGEGCAPMPREMSFPVPKGTSWHHVYDYIRFPSDGQKMPFDSIQKSETAEVTMSPDRPESGSLSKPVQDRVSLIPQTTTPRLPSRKTATLLTSALPELTNLTSVGVWENKVCVDDGGVHVFVHRDHDRATSSMADSLQEEVFRAPVSRPISLPPTKATKQKKLYPDPILHLSRIIGFGGGTMKGAVWSQLGDEVVYPCHAVIVSLKISSGQQRFFTGHTDKVSALALSGDCTLLASVQVNTHTLLRLWDYESGRCLALVATCMHTINTLSFSQSGGILCGVGKNSHKKTMIVVWDTEGVNKTGLVSVLAKAHTDVDIQALQITCCNQTHMVSCGISNVRLWRLRGGSLRSCPLSLGQFQNLEFTDLALQHTHLPEPSEEHTLFVSSKSGHILEVDYVTMAIKNVRRLLPSQQSHVHHREKQTFSTGPGIAVNSISVCDAFCATGSEDGFLRLWTLDFSAVFLEAEHEGPVCHTSISDDGLKVLATTSTGNLGYLDISSRGYSTLMRSHTDTVLGFSVDGIRQQLTTASSDGTIRVWDLHTMQQLYDFVSEDTPSSVAFHPSLPMFCCGSSAGRIRVFDIPTASLLAQHQQHSECVVGCVFSPDGERLFSAGADGTLALYNSAHQELPFIRVLSNILVRGTECAPDALAVSGDSSRLAFVGPTEYTVTIMDARSLDELLRVDVSIMDVESTSLDSALKVCFSTPSSGHILISTSANRILYVNTHTGRLQKQVCDVHKQCCLSLVVSDDSHYLLTAGQNTLKVWDYSMTLDINSQVFIGHSEHIKQLRFTPDQTAVVSVGDAIFLWDFLGHTQNSPTVRVSPPKSADIGPIADRASSSNGIPCASVPFPSLDVSSIKRMEHQALKFSTLCDELRQNPSPEPVLSPTPSHATFLRVTSKVAQGDSSLSTNNMISNGDTGRPDCYKHFVPRCNTSRVEQGIASPPPGEEGLKLKAVIGYNGNGRDNLVWNPHTGLFVYSSGCICVVENLHTGSQRHWLHHTEEISTLAVTHDAQMVASASSGGTSKKSLICIWNVQDGSRRNSMSYHKGAVQSLAFSRDDRYFLSVGDYHEQEVALWSGSSFELLCHITAPTAVHEALFSPMNCNLLSCVGTCGLLFCQINTRGHQTELQVQSMSVPDDVGETELTSLCYSSDGLLFTGTSHGQVCVWECSSRRCFMSWEADEGEIGVMLCSGDRLMCGSNSKCLRLWSVTAVQSLRSKTTERAQDSSGVILEQELQLDGAVVSAVFDDVMEMGIVGTSSGTLWYINWTENSSIRLITGHKSKVNGVQFSPDESRFATCGQDGSVRIWAAPSNELLVQFQVLNQSCECVCWSPAGIEDTGVRVSAGYSDGTVRIFNLTSSEMELKLHPHPTSTVCAVQYSCYGLVLLSAGQDGMISVSNPFTGSTVRVFRDHRGSPITMVQCNKKQYKEFGLQGDELWLAASNDRRVSVWAADWKKGECDLLDWLTFPGPAPPEDEESLPPTLAAFSPTERGILVYSSYGVDKEVNFYCLIKKQVLRSISLTEWAQCLSLSSKGRLLSIGSKGRVVKLVHSSSGRFQDFPPHSDCVHLCSFSPSGQQLLTAAHNEIFLWSVHSL